MAWRLKTATVVVRPRIHMTLISMHAGGPRRNGGLGFGIAGPPARLTIQRDAGFRLSDLRAQPLAQDESNGLLETLANVRQQFALSDGASVSIAGDLLTHHGMGSGTALKLAAIEGYLALHEIQLPQARVAQLSGRGGTSGVGIRTYFDGGFVCDLGVDAAAPGDFAPSSSVASPGASLLLRAGVMPDWPLGLCIPRSCRPKTRSEEISFFARTVPLPVEDSYEAAYWAIFGAVAAVSEQNYGRFCESVTRIQGLTWKRCERAEYGAGLERTAENLLRMGADCVGMSSLGPMLYFFADAATLSHISSAANELDANIVLTRPENHGRELMVA